MRFWTDKSSGSWWITFCRVGEALLSSAPHTVLVLMLLHRYLPEYPTAHLDIAASLRSKPVNLTPDLLQYIHQSLPANAVSSAHWPWQALAASASDLDKLEAINQVVEALKSQKKWQAILDFAGARLAEEQVMPETVRFSFSTVFTASYVARS